LQGKIILDIYVKFYYNGVAKGAVEMDFLDRLRVLMEKHGDNNSTLAKKSGIPYTTIDGLFKRGWEKAQISTIQKICNHYNVTLDYMVYGAWKLSEESLIIAAQYESISPYGKAMIDCIVEQDKNFKVVLRMPVMEGAHDSDVYVRYHAKNEVKELENEPYTKLDESIST
jgi:hypothetical protein